MPFKRSSKYTSHFYLLSSYPPFTIFYWFNDYAWKPVVVTCVIEGTASTTTSIEATATAQLSDLITTSAMSAS